jgi:pimeloyl-ACP methyl ester carboxylesterase
MTATRTVTLPGTGPVEVTVSEYGDGRPFLLLHGGGGPDTVTGFGELLAKTHGVRVVVPVHPGFGGTARPGALASIGDLAALYVALIDQLELEGATLVGNSVGGWIAAEMALLGSPRVSAAILVDAVGIEVPGHPIADFFSLTMDEVFTLSFHNPGPFRVDPAALPPAAQAVAAGNRAALAVYAGTAMSDPTLAGRLGHLDLPTLVLWGDSDQIVDPGYGRGYAAAIPVARFQLLKDTGHMPQLETPDQLMNAIWDRAGSASGTKGRPAHPAAEQGTNNAGRQG